MNIYLLFACMVILPVVLGHGVLRLLYFKQAQKFHIADKLIVGWLTVIGLAEAAHLAAVFLGWSFSKVVRFFVIESMALALVLGGIYLWDKLRAAGGKGKRKKKGGIDTKKSGTSGITPLRFGMGLVFSLLVIWQIVTIVSGDAVYRTGDMTVETVESFLKTDKVYEVNPLTGRAYESGIPLRIKILGLPTLYGTLCSLFDLSGMDLVWKYIPVMVLLLSYMAFWLIGKALFDGERKLDKRLLFMVFTAAVFCVGDYLYGMDGFGLLHCGFQGVTIRNAVLVPYTFSLALRRKWRPAALVVLAESCIAWTLYGMGVSFFVLLGMGFVCIFQNRKTEGFRDVRKEA